MWDTIDDAYFDEDEHPLKWPDPLQCLTSFSSAMRTCRYFHDAMTLVTNGESAVQRIQRIQYTNVENILDLLTNEVSSGLTSVAIFYSAAGSFWKNPKVQEPSEFLLRVLMWIPQRSRLMLMPHLESWVLRRAYPSNLCGRIGTYLSDQGIMCLNGGAIKDYWVTSILDVAKWEANDANDEDCPAVEDILNSRPESWWMFPSTDYGSNEDEWTLVNYDDRKIYSGPNAASWYRWEDIWDVENWKTNKEEDM